MAGKHAPYHESRDAYVSQSVTVSESGCILSAVYGVCIATCAVNCPGVIGIPEVSARASCRVGTTVIVSINGEPQAS